MKKVAATPRGEKETARLLQTLSSLLQGRKFRQFWSAIDKVEGGKDVEGQVAALKRDSKGWEQAIREEIAKEVELSFRSVKKETLAGFMGTQGKLYSFDTSERNQADPVCPDFNEIAGSREWSIKEQDVQLPQNDSNTPKSSVTHERIEIERELPLLSSLFREIRQLIILGCYQNSLVYSEGLKLKLSSYVDLEFLVMYTKMGTTVISYFCSSLTVREKLQSLRIVPS